MAEAKARKGKVGKKFLAALSKITFGKSYSISEGFKLLPEVAFAKFDETVSSKSASSATKMLESLSYAAIRP